MVYYPTLISEMAKRKIKKKELAETAGICFKSLQNRLSGAVPFTWPEVYEIQKRFFPDMTVEVLFARFDQDGA